MAKRFLNTSFLDQKWIRKLSPERKNFLIYLMLKCDNGGIIDLDMEDAEHWIGKKIGDPQDFLPEDYLIKLYENSDKHFQPKFIEHQYGNLKSDKNIVKQARQILDKHGLIDSDFNLILPKNYLKVRKKLPKSQVTSNSNSNSNSIGKSKEEKIKFAEFVSLTELEYQKLAEKHGEYWTKKMIEKLDNYKGSNGKNYKSDYRAILNWVVNEITNSENYRNYQAKKIREERQRHLIDLDKSGNEIEKRTGIKLAQKENE